jgi:hypothetical protein
VALLAIPLHVGKTVRHACKLPSPWPIKGGAIPQPQGQQTETIGILARLSPLTSILALASINTSGT